MVRAPKIPTPADVSKLGVATGEWTACNPMTGCRPYRSPKAFNAITVGTPFAKHPMVSIGMGNYVRYGCP